MSHPHRIQPNDLTVCVLGHEVDLRIVAERRTQESIAMLGAVANEARSSSTPVSEGAIYGRIGGLYGAFEAVASTGL